MKTKICSGKHGCGKELPIDNFRKRIVRGKYYLYNTCSECMRIAQAKRRATEEGKKMIKKYTSSKKFLMTQRRYAKNHPEKIKAKRKRYHDSSIKELKDSYIKLSLRQIFCEINSNNITPELIEAKRNQLKLYRYAKEQCK